METTSFATIVKRFFGNQVRNSRKEGITRKLVGVGIVILTISGFYSPASVYGDKCGWVNTRGYPEWYGPCGGVAQELSDLIGPMAGDRDCREAFVVLSATSAGCAASLVAAIGGTAGTTVPAAIASPACVGAGYAAQRVAKECDKQVRYENQRTPRVRTKQHPGIDIPGNDIRGFDGITYDSCLSQCTGDYGCRAFYYVRGGGKCYLKSGYDSRNVQEKPFEHGVFVEVFR